MGDAELATPLSALGAEVGARDLFVLRRVEAGRWAHLGGSGRGEGWAGVVELTEAVDPHGASAVASGDVVRVRAEAPVRVFGPYWSAQAAVVPLDHDRLVVLGGLDADAPASDDVLRAVAERAADAVSEVSPAKRLADELEVVHAIKEVLTVEAPTLRDTMQAVCTHITSALSCELGVLWLREPDEVVVSEREGQVLGAEPGALAVAMARLVAAGLPSCEQDAALAPLPDDLHHEGIRSWYAVAIGSGASGGALLVCHTDAAPRGFTLLCQDLGARAADAAGGVLRAAALRGRLECAARNASLEARMDGLTGLGNRLAWDEAARRCDEPLGVVFADIDGLKAVNDAHGHHAGDALLVAMAGVLRQATRQGDLCVRLGGDEFAVLLPGADGLAVRTVVERLEELLDAHPPVAGQRLRATIGMACGPPQRGAEGALRAADAIVCAVKAERPAGRGGPSAA